MNDLIRDLRYSLRSIRKRPGFAAAIILSLALGVGANTAVFSIANMLLIRPLPFPEDEELVRIHSYLHRPGRDPRRAAVSEVNAVALREQATVFEDLAVWHYGSYNLVGGVEPIQVYGARCNAASFSMMGVSPQVGRVFSPEEDQPGSPADVVVIGHALWQNHFAADREVVGRTLKINDRVYTVLGVMPPEYEYPYKSQLWFPFGLAPVQTLAVPNSLHAVGRLEEGVSLERATQELEVIADRLAQERPDTNANWTFGLMPLREDLTRRLQPKRVLFILMAGAAFLLLIACANVANILLTRSLEQSGEVAIRLALGIGRWRLVRQLLTQGLLLALLGGSVGIVLAYWTVKPLVALNPGEALNVIFLDVRLDYRVLTFSLLLSLVVGILFSLAPALKISRPDLRTMLMEGSRTTPSRTGRRLVKAMVIAEVAVTVVLLIGSGLMLRSLSLLQASDAGFRTDGLIVLRISPSEVKYPDQQRRVAYLREIVERLEAVPGVTAAAMSTLFPTRSAIYGARALPEGRPADDPESLLITNHRVVSPGLVEAMGLRLLQGRDFTEQDREDTEPVVIVSETFVKNAWPDDNPLDRRVRLISGSGEFPWMRVVGVVGDVIDNGDFGNTWYLPFTQDEITTPYLDLLIRGSAPPETLTAAVRDALWSVDPEQAIAEIATAQNLVTEGYWQERSSTFLLGMFATVGLLLAIVGIYGIQSYTVQQQNHENGVRMVFGARPRDVVMAALKQGMTLSVIGLVIGLAGAFYLSRFLGSQLHEVSPTDPLTFLVTVAVALVVSLVANYIPARRVTKIDPVEILRY